MSRKIEGLEVDEYARRLVYEWVRGDTLGPTQRHPKSWWKQQFMRIGVFDATYGIVQVGADRASISVEVSLTPLEVEPEHLFRGAPARLADGWSWTDSLETASRFATRDGYSSRIWTCIPAQVFGRINMEANTEDHGHIQVTEWIVEPANITRYDGPVAETA